MAHDISVRFLQLPFPAELDPLSCAGGAEESCFNVALSLLLPFLEPYLIRSMNAARAHIDDPDLLADLEQFNAQEGQHYRQHKRFNDAVRASGFPGLPAFEATLAADYQRFTEKRSLRFNLAYAEGFEALTMTAARVSLEQGLPDRYQPVVRDLYLWHLVEELEHRTVAFDVYESVCGGWLYRIAVAAYAQVHMLSWVMRVMLHLLAARKDEWRKQHGGVAGAVKRLAPLVWMELRFIMPRAVMTFMPWYSPHRIAMPERARVEAAHYKALAAATLATLQAAPPTPSAE